MFEKGSREELSSIGLQGFEENHFGRVALRSVAFAGAAKTSALAHMEPVCGSVDGAVEMLRVYKGFEENQGMAERVLPVCGQSPLAQRQDARTKVWKVPVGKDQKTAVVGKQLQTSILVA